MKRFKIPRIEETESDYRLWGLTIPKIHGGHPGQGARPSQGVSEKDASPKPKAGLGRAPPPQAPPPPLPPPRPVPEEGAPRENGQPEQFADIVFSFFSSTDRRYVVRGSSGEHADVNGGPPAPEPGNDYEIMSGSTKTAVPVAHYASAIDLNDGAEDHTGPLGLHRSELRFYVSATSLRNDCEFSAERDGGFFDSDRSEYIVLNRSLNDLNAGSEREKDEPPRYQNSASLDNLSQVCNISLENAGSKRSIASLPELESPGKKARDFVHNPFAFPKLSSVTPKSSVRSEYSSYFDSRQRAAKLKNRISALYSAHKGFRGKKRLSKAWYGIKEWFETEKIKMDNAIHKHSSRRVTTKSSGDDYPDSEFSDYEDVPDGRGSVSSFGKDGEYRETSALGAIDVPGGGSIVSDDNGKRKKLNLSDETKLKRKEVRSLSACNSAGKLNLLKDSFPTAEERRGRGTLRQSRSQPSVVLISDPVLVKVNCENGDSEDAGRGSPPSPDCGSHRSDVIESIPETPSDAVIIDDHDRFADLRSIVKEGSIMCKELLSILQQRAEAERQYCCGVLRVGARARRAAKGASGAALAARRAALDTEARAQLHRHFSNRLVEEVVRPLQRLVATRDAVRKQLECDVGRTARRLSELRDSEAKAKKMSHAAARFNERLQDTSVGRGATPAQETELRRKKTKSEDAASKADVEYYTACVRAERSRVEWETSVVRALETMVELEEERLAGMRKALRKYAALALLLGPGAPGEETGALEAGMEAALAGEERVARGLLVSPPPAMRLPDFYCQHITLAMNRERRKQALLRILEMIKIDTERERKSKQALEKLCSAISTTPSLAVSESQQNMAEKMYQMRSLLTYLEGARVQAGGALASLAGRPRPPHPLAHYLRVIRDRRGTQQTILAVPQWLQRDCRSASRSVSGAASTPPLAPPSPPSPPLTPPSPLHWADRGAADGVSIQHYSDIDEYSHEPPPARPPLPVLPVDEFSDSPERISPACP